MRKILAHVGEPLEPPPITPACQAAIDMAMYVVAERHLGVPRSMADAFGLLQWVGITDAPWRRRSGAWSGSAT